MNDAGLTVLLLDGIVLVLALTALVAFALAALARTLFVSVTAVTAGGACIAASFFVRGGGDAGLAVAVLLAAWAPVMLLGAMLLTGRVAKATPRVRAAPILACAVVVLAAIGVPAVELAGTTPSRLSAVANSAAGWLACLMLVAALGCLGLLGYGERGALSGARAELDQ